MQYRNVEGFKFLHVANAFLTQVPLKTIFEGREIEWDVALDLLYPEVLDAEQSCYLVYANNEEHPVYVGQYSGRFKDRWLNNKYIWHSKHDDKIKAVLDSGGSISIWLSVDPYTSLKDGHRININKVIEQIIIESEQPLWNTVGKTVPDKKGVPVSDICAKYEKKLPDMAKSIFKIFEEKNLDNYLDKLFGKGEMNWGELQNKKATDLSRCRHFLNYISSGVKPDNALGHVWKEFP